MKNEKPSPGFLYKNVIVWIHLFDYAFGVGIYRSDFFITHRKESGLKASIDWWTEWKEFSL